MAHTDRSEQGPEQPERIVLDGLRSFFAEPRHFDRVVFSVKKSTAQLAGKLAKITDELVAIDGQSESLEQTAGNVLTQLSRQKVAEDVGAAILGSTYERLRQLCRRRAALEVFEQHRPWCRLYRPQRALQAEADLRPWFVESVVVYIRSTKDTSAETSR